MATQYGAQGSGMGNQKIPLWGLVLEIGGGKSNRHWDGTYGITPRARDTGTVTRRELGGQRNCARVFRFGIHNHSHAEKERERKKVTGCAAFLGGVLGFAGRHGRAGWQGWQGRAGLGERVGMGWMGPRVMLISAMFSPPSFFPPRSSFFFTYLLLFNRMVGVECWGLLLLLVFTMYGVVWHPFECWEAGGARVRLCWERRGGLGEGRRGVCLMIGVV
jgi:hypothetical protein